MSCSGYSAIELSVLSVDTYVLRNDSSVLQIKSHLTLKKNSSKLSSFELLNFLKGFCTALAFFLSNHKSF